MCPRRPERTLHLGSGRALGDLATLNWLDGRKQVFKGMSPFKADQEVLGVRHGDLPRRKWLDRTDLRYVQTRRDDAYLWNGIIGSTSMATDSTSGTSCRKEDDDLPEELNVREKTISLLL